MSIKYIISLDLSTKSTGVSIFNIDSKELISSSAVDSKMPTGLKVNKYNQNMVRVTNMLSNVDEYINKEKTNHSLDLNNKNTIVVIERRLSGFSKFTTNKTIESLAQLSGLAIKHFNIDNNYQTCHINVTTWQNELFGPKKDRDKDTKALSLKFVEDTYGITGITDDEADSICIGDYYLNNKIYNTLNAKNVKESLYKTHAKTLVESFSLIDMDSIYNKEEGNKKNRTIKQIIANEEHYENVFAIDDGMLLYASEVK